VLTRESHAFGDAPNGVSLGVHQHEPLAHAAFRHQPLDHFQQLYDRPALGHVYPQLLSQRFHLGSLRRKARTPSYFERRNDYPAADAPTSF